MKGEFHRLCRPRIISLKRLKRKKKRRGEEKHVYREGEKGEGIGWKKNASRGVKWHGGGGRRGETSLRSLHGLFFCFFGKEISLLRCDWKSLAPPPSPPLSSIVRNEFSSQDILNLDLNRFQPRQRKRLSYCASFNLFDYRHESRILLRRRFHQRELERIIQFCSNGSSLL